VSAEYSAASACEKSQLIHLVLSFLSFIFQPTIKRQSARNVKQKTRPFARAGFRV
jgi:hypothetical protein